MKINTSKLIVAAWILSFWRWDFVMLLSNVLHINASIINMMWLAVIAVMLIVYATRKPFTVSEGMLPLVIMVAFYMISFMVSFNERGMDYFKNFILYVIPGSFIISQIEKEDIDKAVNVLCCSCFIVFGIFAFLPFQGALNSYNDIAYFGTGMVYGENVITPCFIGMYVFCRKARKNILMILPLLCMMLGLVLANRSCVLVCLTFVVLYSFYVEKVNGKTIAIFSLIAIIVLIIMLNLETILNGMIDILNQYGIHSYALTKYRMALLSSDDTFFSGRNDIFPLAIQYFLKNPVFGIGFGSFFMLTGHAYVHNIFLDWFSSLGLMGGLIMAIITGIALVKTFQAKEYSVKELLCILLSLWFPRLLFSKTFADDISYWMYIVFALSIMRNKKVYRLVLHRSNH